jgi:hypothetical protein
MKTDHIFNAAFGINLAALVFFFGWLFGHRAGEARLGQALSAQRAQSVRDLSKYPLGQPHFFLSPAGLGATCER